MVLWVAANLLAKKCARNNDSVTWTPRKTQYPNLLPTTKTERRQQDASTRI